MERQDAGSSSWCEPVTVWLNSAGLLACHNFGPGNIGHVLGKGKTEVLEERCTFDGTDNRW